MIRPQRHPIFALLGLVVLAIFVFAVVQASCVHTDDGCAVEVHCRACLWSYAAVGVVSLCVTLGIVLELAGQVVPLWNAKPAHRSGSHPTTRGPPRT